MTTIWLVEHNDYEGGYVEGVWDNEAAANNHVAALREVRGDCYSVDEVEVRSVSTHRVERWFQATASWNKVDGYDTHCFPRTNIFEANDGPKMGSHKVERYRVNHANPGYVRDTPNARIPDTPGGRYVSTPAWGVVAESKDEAVANERALVALDAALAADGVDTKAEKE